MSRASGGRGTGPGRFPRVSGDEPEMLMKKDNMRGFSPRERG